MKAMPKPLQVLVTLAVLASVFFSGCGPQATAAPTAAPTAVPPTAEPTAEAAAGPTATPPALASEEGSLTIWVNAERAPIMEAAGKEFTAKYNIPVRIQTMSFNDVRSNFEIAAPVGNGPDIIAGAHDWIGALYASGLLASIDLGDKVASFDPVGIKAFTYDGQLVGMPYQVEATAMYYNKDLLPTPPATWQEAKDAIKKLMDEGKIEQGIAFVGGDFYGHYPVITGFGGYAFGRDANGNYDPTQVGFDSEGTIKAATELDSMLKAGLLHDGITYDVAKDLFLKGKLAMWVNGPWEMDNIRKSGLNYGIAVIPKMEQAARPFVGVQGFMVNKYSKNLLLAQAFLTEFVASDDIMMKLYQAQFGIPAWIPIRSQINDADIQTFADSVGNGDPMPAIPEMGAVWSAANNAFSLLYQQKGAPADIMKEAANAIRGQIKK
jgi:maltose-binding protein MalE